ncbi:MAG TPA: hypothetical protein VK508_03410 [Cyclobacteriaceae bacterium]|nr:hypothetical protein [Cyclobacteriaceae bacterium]
MSCYLFINTPECKPNGIAQATHNYSGHDPQINHWIHIIYFFDVAVKTLIYRPNPHAKEIAKTIENMSSLSRIGAGVRNSAMKLPQDARKIHWHNAANDK